MSPWAPRASKHREKAKLEGTSGKVGWASGRQEMGPRTPDASKAKQKLIKAMQKLRKLCKKKLRTAMQQLRKAMQKLRKTMQKAQKQKL